jgi:Ala-tRNA(Pro) deacylase
VQVQLSRDEAALLAEVLSTYLGELRSEVFHTEDYVLRQELKRREGCIGALIGRLAPGAEKVVHGGDAMRCRERLIELLKEQDVPFQLHHHPAAYTAQEVAEKEHVPGDHVAKVVLAVADGRQVMLALPATHRLDLLLVATALGAREVHLAAERDLGEAFPDCDLGAMPPFGNLYGLPVYVDRALAADDSIVVPAGTHTDTIELKYVDFAALAHPVVAAIAYHV